ncbi:hypothetical protein QA584_17255 [Anaerocolumna sp. AGMB13025]|uniref:hypothetical protein n=1 Tax=Anaerocolumna sp. AGMB13025 TaxID=3039116 RepID=UPI00241C0418|nr:hypothetical protein [Anaerocolumna sp. AGMB13025]WFR55348.1 hypothetical protein QA584_17255 [Anaerocolumna sp. AGMB13025]
MYEVEEIEASEDISEAEINDLKILYQTPVGSIPMEREKGIDMEFLSMSTEVAKNMFAVEIIKKTRLYFGLKVTDILFNQDDDGKITVKVVISRGE